LNYTITGKPAWLTLEKTPSGPILKGTPPKTLIDYTMTVTAADGRGKSASVTLHITVQNSAPTWNAPADSRVAANASGYSVTLPAASDNEQTSLTYSIVAGLPPGLSFDADATKRVISGVPSTPGVYTVTARVSDGTLSTDMSFVITVTNIGPTWEAVPNRTIPVNESTSVTVPAAVDPEGQALAYSAPTLPSWLTFDAMTYTLTGTPPRGGTYAVTLQATDPGGEKVQVSFSFVVINRAPTWGSVIPFHGVASIPVTYQPTAAVDPDRQSLTYSASGLPAGLSINASTGAITGTTNSVGSFTVTLSAADADGATATTTLVMQFDNAPPVYNGGLAAPEFFIVSGDEVNIPFPPSTFTDPNGDALTATITVKVGNATVGRWLSISTVNRQRWLTGTAPRVTNTKTYTVIVTATDSHGASAEGRFSITVHPDGAQIIDDTPPPAEAAMAPAAAAAFGAVAGL
jgi:hypothetical protein